MLKGVEPMTNAVVCHKDIIIGEDHIGRRAYKFFWKNAELEGGIQ